MRAALVGPRLSHSGVICEAKYVVSIALCSMLLHTRDLNAKERSHIVQHRIAIKVKYKAHARDATRIFDCDRTGRARERR